MSIHHTKMGKYQYNLYPNVSLKIEIPNLIRGAYYYPLYYKSLAQDSPDLFIEIYDGEVKLFEKTVSCEVLLKEEKILFENGFYSSLVILFTNRGNTDIFIRLPVSPVFCTTIENEAQDYFSVASKVFERLRNEQLNSYGIVEEGHYDRANSKDWHPIEGILSLKEAEAQLDYVIMNKLFNKVGARGLVRFKLMIYRNLLRVGYKLLIKNSIRKHYVVKFYRNYLNMDAISQSFINKN